MTKPKRTIDGPYSIDKDFSKPKRTSSPLSDIEETKRAIQDLKEDLTKLYRIYKQILMIEFEEAEVYRLKDKITITENLISTLPHVE